MGFCKTDYLRPDETYLLLPAQVLVSEVGTQSAGLWLPLKLHALDESQKMWPSSSLYERTEEEECGAAKTRTRARVLPP